MLAWPEWEAARAAGEIPPGVALVHLDAHEDMGIPDLEAPLPRDPDAARRLAEADFSVDEVVVPALLNGTVSELVWVTPPWLNEEPLDIDRQIGSVDGKRTEAVVGTSLSKSAFPDLRRFRTRVVGLADLADPGVPYVLDVDLDFFACENPHAGHLDEEIGEDEYDRLRDSGTVRFSGRAAEDGRFTDSVVLARPPGPFAWPVRIDAVKEVATGQVRYLRGFMCMGLYRDAFPVHRPEPGGIETAVRILGERLRTFSNPPALVTIARSVTSGFAPREPAAEAERRLLDLMADLNR